MGIAADIVLIVVAAFIGGALARRLGQPLMVGYILAGVAVGPHTAGPTVGDIHDIELLAEIGVALLLFALGLEVRFKDMAAVKRLTLLGGPLQIALTTLFGFGLGRAFLDLSVIGAVWFGSMIALSSTMVVLKTMNAGGRAGTLASRAMIGLLVVQDLAVAPMLVVLPRLGDLESALPDLGFALLKALAFLAAMVVLGTRLIPWVLETIARWRSRELFLVAVTAVGVGVGYATYLVGLSFAFGAFAAGMVVSESEVSHQALADIVPLRDVFGLLFFASAGMLFDPAFLLENAVEVAVMLTAVMVGKFVIVAGLAAALGYGNRAPWIMGLGLAQVGEFAFVLARVGAQSGDISERLYNLALTVTLFSMILSPALCRFAEPAFQLWRKLRPRKQLLATLSVPDEGLRDHVIITGYGKTGYAAARVLSAAAVPFVVIEYDRPKAEVLRHKSPVVWGDATRPEILEAAGVAKARLLFVAIPEESAVLMVIQSARAINSSLAVVARAASQEQLEELNRLGVTDAVQPQLEAGLEMVGLALNRFGWPAAEIQRFNQGVRSDLYRSLQGASLPPSCRSILEELHDLDPAFDVEWAAAGSEIAGKTLEQLDVRRLTGASVVAVRGGQGTQPNPGPEHIVEGGDTVLLLGAPEQRSAARELLAGKAAAPTA